MKKKFLKILFLITLVSILFVAGYTFARYYTSIEAGNVSSSIAKWSFGSSNTNTNINLSDEKLAPGSSGDFQIEVDATGSEVNVEYEILVSNEENIPTNMTFSADIKDATGNLVKEIEAKNSMTELASNLNGTIDTSNNQKRIITVYWNWEFEDNDEGVTDSRDATLSFDNNGKSSLDCGFDLEIIGKQAKAN